MTPDEACLLRAKLTEEALIRSQPDLSTATTAIATVRMVCDKLFPMMQARRTEISENK